MKNNNFGFLYLKSVAALEIFSRCGKFIFKFIPQPSLKLRKNYYVLKTVIVI